VGSERRSDDLIIAGRESGIERSVEHPKREWTFERSLRVVDCWCPRAADGRWIGRAVFQGHRVSGLRMLG
jgi:hypothetical protein